MNKNCLTSKRATQTPSEKGFTLLEMMVAVMIFATISTISYASLIRYFDQSEKIEASHLRLEQIQRLFSLLEQDVRYLVARPVQYNNATYAAMEVYKNRPVFEGEVMQFTTSRPVVLNNMTQTNYRVSWRLIDNQVYRYSWTELDLKGKVLEEKDDLQHVQRVASGIESFEVQVSLAEDVFEQQNTFNEQAYTNDFDDALYALPRLVRVTITTDSGREYFRIIDSGSAELQI